VGLRDAYDTIRTRWAVHATRDDLPAVGPERLDRLLDQANMRKKFERGEVLCKFCREPVTRESVYAFARDSGTVKAVCFKPACVTQFLEWIESR